MTGCEDGSIVLQVLQTAPWSDRAPRIKGLPSRSSLASEGWLRAKELNLAERSQSPSPSRSASAR